MKEELPHSDLAQSRHEKRIMSDPRERQKAIAKQSARISKKLIDRALASRLAVPGYGASEGSYAIYESGPAQETFSKTAVEVDHSGNAYISKGVENGISEVSTIVSVVPSVGIGVRKYGRAGDHEVNQHLESEKAKAAVNAIPGHLAELRGTLAEEESEVQSRRSKFKSAA